MGIPTPTYFPNPLFLCVCGGSCALQHCRILVPRPGIEPMSPAMEAQSLKCWTTREVLLSSLNIYKCPRDHTVSSHLLRVSTPKFYFHLRCC